MTREARANLVFVVIFLAVSLPGLFILVRKKSDPLARPMWIPDGRRDSFVYIDPIDAPSSVPRITPALTSVWLADEARERFSLNSLATVVTPDGGSTVVISQNRFFQLLGVKPAGNGVRVYLVFWNLPRGDSPVELSISLNDQPIKFNSVETQIPNAVKKDLQDSGMPRPPQRLWWLDADLPTVNTGEMTLRFSGVMDGRDFSDTLTLSAN